MDHTSTLTSLCVPESSDVEKGQAIVAYLRSTRPRVDFETAPLVSLRNRFAYFPIGKVANSSIKALLYKSELAGTGRKPPNDKQVHNVAHSPMVLPYQLGDENMGHLLASAHFRKVAFVRNPYDRLLSCYLDRAQKQDTLPYKKAVRALGLQPGIVLSFADFVRSLQDQINADIHWRPQWVELGGGLIEFDYIGRFEDLSDDIAEMLTLLYPGRHARLGFQSPARTNASQRRAEYYDATTVEIVSRLYAEDFQHFGYELL